MFYCQKRSFVCQTTAISRDLRTCTSIEAWFSGHPRSIVSSKNSVTFWYERFSTTSCANSAPSICNFTSLIQLQYKLLKHVTFKITHPRCPVDNSDPLSFGTIYNLSLHYVMRLRLCHPCNAFKYFYFLEDGIQAGGKFHLVQYDHLA